MSEFPPEETKNDRLSLRGQFPQHFPPSSDQIKDFFVGGLVAFDTNALFDLYRFNSQARKEFLAALKLLGDRLWIPNRVAEEFTQRRSTIIKECSTAIENLSAVLEKTLIRPREVLSEFGNRRGLSTEQRQTLAELVDGLHKEAMRQAVEFYRFDLDASAPADEDAILMELESILKGRIGPPLDDIDAAKREAIQRIEDRVPPGYEDAKKDPSLAVGDYLIWRQLIDESARRKLPVVLVTNEKKSDWVHKGEDGMSKARSELVAEMHAEAGTDFFLTNVHSFLAHAAKDLGAAVSKATYQQAKAIYETPPALVTVLAPVQEVRSEIERRLRTAYIDESLYEERATDLRHPFGGHLSIESLNIGDINVTLNQSAYDVNKNPHSRELGIWADDEI
ncbi:PIN-like domain-containing protein [Actinoallomurus sp. CA-150999]|uniref:PIN-like domain-containing protein n=1 Tax=Actinoallomurus sp. CA-150999 TaxID=3239887 RepID=UPI003D8AC5D1